MRKSLNLLLLLLLLLLCCQSAKAQNNKGGRLEIEKARAWHSSFLIREDDCFSDDPVIHTIKPKQGKSFVIVSSEIAIDWSGFPKATQYHLKTKEVKLISGSSEYKSIGQYRKGGRYSSRLSSSLFPQRDSGSPYFLDLVFCVPRQHRSFRLRIGEAESSVSVQEGSQEPPRIPATFKILRSAFINELPSGDLPRKLQEHCTAALKPVSGKFLKLTVQLVAHGAYGENVEGMYKNDFIPLGKKYLGIMTRDAGYIPAVAGVLTEKAYHGTRIVAHPDKNSTVTSTCVFCVPNQVSVVSLFYNKQMVIKDFRLEQSDAPDK